MRKLQLVNIFIILLGAVFLCGCSTLSYSGDDFDKSNVKSITTNEMFYFSTYAKDFTTKENGVIKIASGISKSAVNEILVAYFEVNNKSDCDYTLSLSDIKIYTGSKLASLVSPENYIINYQGEQSELYVSTQSIAPTVSNMVNIANNYQNNGISQLAREQTASSASTRQLNEITTGIREHVLYTNSTIKPMEKKYYYLFIKDEEEYPVKIEYKGLQYVFDVRKK